MTTENTLTSSVNKIASVSRDSVKSFINREKRQGPSKETCGTPDVRDDLVEMNSEDSAPANMT